MPSGSQYITLSHCWGESQVFTLTQQNQDALTKKIDNSRLSQTFQDAICVARELDVEYLWIDSLCILQDCESDWLAESVRMGKVYANGVCNIAATFAKDGRDGLFRERNPVAFLPVMVTANSPSPPSSACGEPQVATQSFRAARSKSDSSNINVPQATAYVDRLTPGDYHIIECNIFDTELNKSPLLRRAWVVQERLLAPRVLHFGVRQLLFECNNHYQCESYPLGVPGRARENSIWKPSTAYFGSLKPTPNPWAIDPWRVAWMNLIPAYSRGQLSYAKDKLVAVHGIATRMNTNKEGKYIAGLWEEILPELLLWRVSKPTSRPDVHQAPSWSWAAVNGAIEQAITWGIWKQDHKFVATVERVHQISPLGTIMQVQAELHVRGALYPATLVPSQACAPVPNPGRTYVLQVHGIRCKGALYLDHARIEPTAKFYALPFLTYPSYPDPLKPTPDTAILKVEGLLLHRDQGTKGMYQRMGMFESVISETEGLPPLKPKKTPEIETDLFTRFSEASLEPYSIVIV